MRQGASNGGRPPARRRPHDPGHSKPPSSRILALHPSVPSHQSAICSRTYTRLLQLCSVLIHIFLYLSLLLVQHFRATHRLLPASRFLSPVSHLSLLYKHCRYASSGTNLKRHLWRSLLLPPFSSALRLPSLLTISPRTCLVKSLGV
jgi:hypothetical protein